MNRKQVHAFAANWSMKFANPDTTPYELLDDQNFPDSCFSFGFKMDCGEMFMEKYSSEALNKVGALQKVIADIDDIDFLGSAIFSQWRYFNHWAYSPEEINTPNARAWFVCALSRLMALTQPMPESEFSLEKIMLVSNCIGYGPEPLPDDEVEQHLTICSDGQVRLHRYAYGGGFDKLRLMEDWISSINTDAAEYVLKQIAKWFYNNGETAIATDVGSWELTVTGKTGNQEVVTGNLIPDDGCLKELSDLIRYHLDRSDLMCFDDGAILDKIENIKIEYSRITKIKPGVIPEGATWEYATWAVSESIEIDRETEIIRHIHNPFSECNIRREYHIAEGVKSFLDGFEPDELFSEIEGNLPEAISDPLDTREYTITVTYSNSEPRILHGFFDKHSLPSDFADFAEELYGFIKFYGEGEILNPSMFGRVLRKQDELIFCNVAFEEYGRTYCYLTTDESIEAGDVVVVPVGADNHESLALVESIEYHIAEEAPFPIDKIKSIIRKHGNEEPEEVDNEPDVENRVFQWETICQMVDSGEGLTPELKELFEREPEKKEQYKWKVYNSQ